MTSNLQRYDMAFSQDPVGPQINDIIQARSGREVVQIIRGLRSPATQAAFTAALLLAPPIRIEPEPAAAPEKAKKALNAFVGFRCYYITIPIFKQFPMKKLSNLVGQLWEVDPNKSLWSLLAKAWSAIRDQVGKDNAPLTDFFLIICPYLKVPSPETYLEDHGWMLKLNNEGSPVLCRDADAVPTATLSAGFADMTLSVEDITSICQTAGYAQNYVPKQDLTSSTFLGCSVNPTLKKSAQQPSTTQAVSTVQRMRVAARNNRRARRATAAALRQQIAIAHGADPNIPITAYETDVVDDEPEELEEPEEPSEFYNNLTELLVGNAAQTEPENMEPPTENGADLDANSSEFSDIVNWGAFRPGADEGIYMPSFDEDQI